MLSKRFVLAQTAELLNPSVEALVEPTDEELAAEVLAGRSQLFALIYRRYFPRAFRLASGICGNREQADDLTQEIFLRVYQGLSGFKGNSTFSTWFYRIALNHCLNYCRREKWKKLWLRPETLEAVNRLDSQSEADLLEREIQVRVRVALQSLKPESRIMVILKDIEGFTYQEIADRLECAPGTVASVVSRARKLLAQKLSNLKGNV